MGGKIDLKLLKRSVSSQISGNTYWKIMQNSCNNRIKLTKRKEHIINWSLAKTNQNQKEKTLTPKWFCPCFSMDPRLWRTGLKRDCPSLSCSSVMAPAMSWCFISGEKIHQSFWRRLEWGRPSTPSLACITSSPSLKWSSWETGFSKNSLLILPNV